MKTCTKCKRSKELSAYPKDIRYSSGLGSWCKYCKNLQARQKKYGLKWTKANPEKSKFIKDNYVNNNKDLVLKSKQKYAKANPKKELARSRKYQADKLCRTPKWLTKGQIKEIEQVYINCPKGYHVDHIIPLRGKTVSGLHVPQNLQYLPARVNQRKSNKVA